MNTVEQGPVLEEPTGIEGSTIETYIDDDRLVSPLPYDNSERDEFVFREYVKEYADHVGVILEEKEVGLFDAVGCAFSDLWHDMRNHHRDVATRIFDTCVNMLLIPAIPLGYPLFGAPQAIIVDEDLNRMRVRIPRYEGCSRLLFNNSARGHEYQHAYHAIVAAQLMHEGKVKGLNGYIDIPLEPNDKVPDHDELKAFERQFLAGMLNQLR